MNTTGNFLKICLLGAVLLLPAAVRAQFTFVTNANNTITITGYTGFDTDVSIPETINGLRVTGIGNYAFGSRYDLESIVISDTVTNIGANALLYCGLITISVATNNSAYCSVDGVLFNKRRTVLVRFPPRKTGGYAIPTTVASVGDSAFDDCMLTNVTVPASVTKLGNDVFGDCQFLTSVAILGPVTSIGNASFAGCWSLTKVTLPNTITSFGDSAFASCVALPRISMPSGLRNIGDSAFNYCTSLTNIALPNGVTNIGAYAFEECSGLGGFRIPGGVRRIKNGTFFACETLLGIAI